MNTEGTGNRQQGTEDTVSIQNPKSKIQNLVDPKSKIQNSSLPPHTITEILFSEAQIQVRIAEMGAQITADYAAANEPLLLVGVLKGAALFLADLARAIDRPLEYDFVALASYGAATESSGEVRILKDLDAAVTGKHVLIVEDILDTGMTLRFSYLIENLLARHAASVKVCVLLDKPARRKVEVPVAYRGFTIEDKFVVGYGMDYAESYRNLRYIGVVTLHEDDAPMI